MASLRALLAGSSVVVSFVGLVLVACGDDGAGPGGAAADDASTDTGSGGGDGAAEADGASPRADAAANDASDAGPKGFAEELTPFQGTALATCANDETWIVGNTAGDDLTVEKRSAAGVRLFRKVFSSYSAGALGIACDAAGNALLVGAGLNVVFSAGLSLGPSFWVAKLGATGDAIWAKSVVSPQGGAIGYIAARPNGNVLVSGNLRQTTTIGSTTLTNQGNDDVLLVELAGADGAVVRAKSWGSPQPESGGPLALGANDAVFMAGRSGGALDFGAGALSDDGGVPGAYVVELGPDFGVVAQRALPGGAEARVLVPAPGGGVYLGGRLYGTTDLGGGPLTTAGLDDVLVGRFDAQLGHVWSKRFGVAETERLTAGTPTASGVVFAGSYATAWDGFGTGAMKGPDGLFVVRFDANGTALASFASGTGGSAPSNPTVYGVAAEGNDALVLATVSGPLALPSGPFVGGDGGSASVLARIPF